MFQETETPKIFSESETFLCFGKGIFRTRDIFGTRSIFRTLAYSEPKAYLEYCQTSTMEPFSFKIKKFLTFQEIISYILGNGTFFLLTLL